MSPWWYSVDFDCWAILVATDTSLESYLAATVIHVRTARIEERENQRDGYLR